MIDITTAADDSLNTRRVALDDGQVVTEQLTHHSQLCQDLWVLTQLGHKRGGVFVDIGAHDGIHFSNTYILEKGFGWTGVCVEPHPETYCDLRLNRECECLNCAAWSETGKVLQFNQHPEHPMLSGLLESGATKVETLSLNGICQDLGPIDYLSLDTEGSEIEILSTFDVERFKPTCMTIEHNGNGEALSWLINWLTKHGYLWRLWHWDLLAVRDRWQHGIVSHGTPPPPPTGGVVESMGAAPSDLG